MNKSGVFLVIFILLLGIAVVPTEPTYSATQIEPSSPVTTAALATTGTLKIPVAEDVGVANGSYADINFGSDGALMFVGTGFDGEWVIGRSWLKFDLAHLPLELSVTRATLNVYIGGEWVADDEPVGVYHCSDDSWDRMIITWNNQPFIVNCTNLDTRVMYSQERHWD